MCWQGVLTRSASRVGRSGELSRDKRPKANTDTCVIRVC